MIIRFAPVTCLMVRCRNSVFLATMLILQLIFLGPADTQAQTTSAENLKLPPGFKAELLYNVPSEQGSWVSMTPDPQGRLIASDQYGKLYRITPGAGESPRVEEIELSIGFAQGLLCAFDSLYVVSYGISPPKTKKGSKPTKTESKPAGLYRVRDTDQDDKYDSVELLREFVGKSEHGPHAVILSPDKKSLYICAGNATKIPNPETTRVPKLWQEDQILNRLPDARGHAAGRLAPGGWICKTDPEGKSFELVAMGFRNEYDIAFDPNGELFTYDADMEWDVGLPWYRPTRVCHVVSGSEFGWRHGSGKWPEYYPDSVPPVLNIGPGSPTGIVFGTGAKFPADYQNALFISDWSYGMIYAVRMSSDGSTYRATKEKFCSAPALPVTDLVINPVDGAMYFLVGGRRSQSALYRVTYVGDKSVAPATYQELDSSVAVRRKLESFHVPEAVVDWPMVWEKLSDPDRMIRYAARTALELQAFDNWKDRVARATQPQRVLELMTAVSRCGDEQSQAMVVEKLAALDWNQLSRDQRIHLIRVYGLTLCRLGEPTEKTQASIRRLAQYFPVNDEQLDRELAKLLVAVKAEGATAKIVDKLLTPSAQEPQIAYAMILSDAQTGWDHDLREKYFRWFVESAKSKGGNSFGGYISNIKKYAVEKLSNKEKEALSEVLALKPTVSDPYADLKARPVVKQWGMSDFVDNANQAFAGRDLENGKKMFALATCYKCHRMEGQGGIIGPDLTPAGHRFSTRDLIETIVDPSKEISDQYEATIFQLDDGTLVTGRVANLNGNRYMVQENMIDPGRFTNVQVDQIDAMKPSKVSMMPTGLLDTLTREEILDLLAYMKSVGKKAAGAK